MKIKIVLFIVFLLQSSFLLAQNSIFQRSYYDADWMNSDSSNAVYMRLCEFDSIKNEFNGEITDYFLGTTIPEMQGTF